MTTPPRSDADAEVPGGLADLPHPAVEVVIDYDPASGWSARSSDQKRWPFEITGSTQASVMDAACISCLQVLGGGVALAYRHTEAADRQARAELSAGG